MDLYYLLAPQDLGLENSWPPKRSERLSEETNLNTCQLEPELCKAEICSFCLWHILIHPIHTAARPPGWGGRVG